MISLALMFAAIALSDILWGSASQDEGASGRSIARISVLSLVAAKSYLIMGACLMPATLLGGLVFVSVGGWTRLRRAGRHAHALATLAFGLSFVVVANPVVGTEASLDGLGPWVAELPWYDASTPVEFYVLAASMLMFLGPTANAVVRSVLLMASDQSALERSESRLRGGRFIGVLERYLIFGLALAGEPTAAALVISAKSIIRFPEISARTQAGESDGQQSLNEADEITEYFLLGSLTSWTIALAPTALLLAIAD